MKPETRHIIAVLLVDEDADTRRRAAEQLAGSGHRAAHAALVIALQDESKGVRDAATRSLIAAGGASVARAIAFHIADNEIGSRNLAAKILMNLGKAAVPALLPYLRDADKDVRKFAVDILGVIGNKESVGSLLPLLDDSDANVRVATIEALGLIGSKEATLPLCRVFVTDPAARVSVADALKAIADARAQFLLVESVLEHIGNPAADAMLVYAVTDALGAIGDRDAFHELQKHLHDVREELRPVILNALTQIAERCQFPLEFGIPERRELLRGLREDREDVKLSCAKGLSPFKDLEVTRTLIETLGVSEDLDFLLFSLLADRPEIFVLCVESLEFNQGRQRKEVIEFLGKVAPDQMRHHPESPECAINGDILNRAFDAIADQWIVADEETRQIIIETIFRIDGKRSYAMLDRLFAEADPWSQIRLIDQLSAVAHESALEFIGSRIDHEDESVREAAITALDAANESVRVQRS